jgi:hypothetical protein
VNDDYQPGPPIDMADAKNKLSAPHLIVSADPRCPGQYLKSYDPDAHGGRGTCEWTADKAAAAVYPDFAAAFEAWRQVPKSRPRRDDGQPNRPLTAFSVTFEAAG